MRFDSEGWSTAQHLSGVYRADTGVIKDSEEFTNIFSEVPDGGLLFGKSFLQYRIPYAQDGCAQALLKRLQTLSKSAANPN